jgi:hypothetical protein
MRRLLLSLLVCFGLAGAITSRLQAQQASGSILGRWHGHSICIKADWNASCNDEVVVYRFVPSAAGGKQVTMRGFKILNGVEDWMGDIEMAPDAKANQWSGEFSNASVHIRFTFIMTGDSLRGTLSEVPGGRVHRNMTAVRDSAAAP